MIEHVASQIVIPYLIANGIVSAPGALRPWPVYRNNRPDQPDEVVTVYDYEGEFQGRMQRTGEVVEFPGIQVGFRAKSTRADEASIFGKRMCNVLDGILNATVVLTISPGVTKTYQIQSFRRTSPVLPLGPEENGSRLLFTINGLITIGEIA